MTSNDTPQNKFSNSQLFTKKSQHTLKSHTIAPSKKNISSKVSPSNSNVRKQTTKFIASKKSMNSKKKKTLIFIEDQKDSKKYQEDSNQKMIR